MKKCWIRAMILLGLMGSTIGVNAQSITYSTEGDYGYEIIQNELQQPSQDLSILSIEQEESQLLSEEATFKLDITIPYLGENGHIEGLNVLKYDSEKKIGRPYWEGNDLNKEFPVDSYYIQIMARDDNHYYYLYVKTNNGIITFTKSDLVCTTIYNESGLQMKRVLISPMTENSLFLRYGEAQGLLNGESVQLVCNKDVKSRVELLLGDETGFEYGVSREMSMASDEDISFGKVYTSSFIRHPRYWTNEDAYINFPSEILIQDEYGNRVEYVNKESYKFGAACNMTLSKEGYTNTQVAHINGAIRFKAPNTEGAYNLKLEFNENMPIKIPNIEGTIEVYDKNTLPGEGSSFKLNITIPYKGLNGKIDDLYVTENPGKDGYGEVFWEGNDSNMEFPAGNYYVQILAHDDENVYNLFARTNNGNITFTPEELVCITIENKSSLKLNSINIMPNDSIRLSTIGSVYCGDLNSNTIRVISNKNIGSWIDMYAKDSSYIYGFGKDIDTSKDAVINLGKTLKPEYVFNQDKVYASGTKGKMYLDNELLIKDEYGNRISLLKTADWASDCSTMTLSKGSYTGTQIVEINGALRFNVPSEAGQYQFKLEFNKDLPIAIPTIEGQLNVVTSEETLEVQAFVTNLYRYCMDREPDEAGLNGWVQQLQNQEITAADTLKFFVNSQEFANKLTSNQAYIDALYKVCMGRAGDTDGIEYWNSILKAGESRNNILVSFVNSQEFTDICTNYGVVRGSLESEVVDKKAEQIKAFITRFYNNCLGRAPEKEGLEYWMQGLQEGRLTGAELGRSFVTSQEMENKNLSIESYIEVLYDTFMGRSADEGGKQYWMQCIQSGMTREEIMTSFMWSPEFSSICDDYGIKLGL